MKIKRILIFLVLTLMLSGAAQASVIDDANKAISDGINNLIDTAKSLTITSYSSSVPVQIGYDKPSNFWVITGTLGWTKDQLLLVKLPAGTTDQITGTTDKAKAQSEVKIIFDPRGSYETAPMTRQDLPFKTSAWDTGCQAYGCGGGKTAAYKIETGAWLTKTVYDVSVNDQSQTVEVGMGSPADVNLGKGVFVKNLGILSNGANFPGGNWIYVFNPIAGEYELYNTIDVQNAITYWNYNYAQQVIWTNYADGTWLGVWRFLSDKGKLPQKPVLTATKVEAIMENGDYKYIKLTYPRTAQSSFVSLYVPSSLADTIIIQMGGSKAYIVGTPTITSVSDRQYAILTVEVANEGGDDYISVKPTSNYYSFTAVDDTTKFIKHGEKATFTFRAYALDVSANCDKCAPINILADGSDPYSGDNSKTIYGSIYDSDVTVNTDAKLSVVALSPENKAISDAPIFVNGDFKGSGAITITVPKGDYVVKSQNASGFFAPLAKTVKMSGVDQTVNLQFTSAPPVPKEDTVDLTGLFWAALIIFLVYIAWKYGIISTLTKSPTMIILAVVVLLVLYILWQILLAVLGVADAVQSAAANPWLPWNW